MSKKESKTGLPFEESRRKEMLDLCYNRLKEMLPECTSEVTLLKCIEILEKRQETVPVVSENEKSLQVIADTLDRLSAIRKRE